MEAQKNIRLLDLNEIKASHNALPLQALLHPFKELNHKNVNNNTSSNVGMYIFVA